MEVSPSDPTSSDIRKDEAPVVTEDSTTTPRGDGGGSSALDGLAAIAEAAAAATPQPTGERADNNGAGDGPSSHPAEGAEATTTDDSDDKNIEGNSVNGSGPSEGANAATAPVENGEAAAGAGASDADAMEVDGAEAPPAAEEASKDADMAEAAGDDNDVPMENEESSEPEPTTDNKIDLEQSSSKDTAAPSSDGAPGAKENSPVSAPSVASQSTAAAEPAATGAADTTDGDAAPADGGDGDKPKPAPAAQLPVMKGTLCYEEDTGRHLIRGMWNYENSTAFPPQRFELCRTLAAEEDLKKLPQDGEFHGSFSLMYTHITSKGKKKERSKVIPESGVKITFTEQDDGSYVVDGKGTNQFGVFLIHGKATPNTSEVLHDPTYSVELRKRYEEVALPAATADAKSTISVVSSVDNPEGPLPPPSQSYPTGVICLRGKLVKEESVETLGVVEVVHKINGMWAAGLNFLNEGGPTNRFEYEHKSSSSTTSFPVSGRYSGWFDLTNDDGTRTRINERDVTLKFRKNNADGYNIEGRGMNVFGKYNITGTLSPEPENVLTIFRHFQPRKIKAKTTSSAPAVAGPGQQPVAQRRPSLTQTFEPILSFSDVVIPVEAENGVKLEPIAAPANGAYSAVSRGVLRVNDDGAHSCQGKWAVTREHFTNGQTSPFTFRLESHLAAAAVANSSDSRQFPVDSDRYKGSFQLKKQGTRYQTIIDQQVVMKFRMNSQGSYNVYGVGINPIGRFNLLGTLVMSGKTGGQVELYRMYPPEHLAAPPAQAKVPASVSSGPSLPRPESSLVRQPSTASLGAQRRESTRLVKLPSKLEDDDPDALLSRTMSKCAQILRAVREKDIEMGAFFSEPVDPVALGIPSYHQIIKEPMDLRTIHRRMETNGVNDPDEFARLMRLVFQNAITFNVDPTHSVHQAARTLLVMFNQKFREVERIMVKITDEEKAKKGKDEKKRKRDGEPVKSLKRRRLEEAQALANANASFFAEIVSSAPSDSTVVTRTEFNMLLGHLEKLSKQLVISHRILAELTPGDESDVIAPIRTTSGPSAVPSAASVTSSAPERKPPKKKSEPVSIAEPVVVMDDSMPLTLEEQELLTETINELPPEHLGGVIQIIREAAPVGADEDEIDLEIDQLDTRTQRKLLRHVMKFVKKSKVKAKKKPKPAGKGASTGSSAVRKPVAAAPKPKADAGSFFAFGSRGDDSDSDSDDDDRGGPSGGPFGGKHFSSDAAKEFRLGEGLGDLADDNDEDLETAAAWSIPQPAAAAKGANRGDEDDDDDDDDAWGAAREHAAVAKQREADRRAREEKLQAEAEAAKAQRLRDAAARGEEIKAQRAEEEEKEALLKEQQEKEAEAARKKARELARAEIQAVEPTIDLDAQRNLMKQYEQSFLDKDLGSASPSSDFEF